MGLPRTTFRALLITGSLLLVWVERAGDRPVLAMPFPRTRQFWLVWGGLAASLPLFMHLPITAGIFQIQALSASDWGLVLWGSLVAVGWRALPWPR